MPWQVFGRDMAERGFYDRPEIRDLLNILAAIADPTDDLALVGALRSPAFALPDAEIYKLRYPNGKSPTKLIDSLHASAILHSSFAFHPHRASRIIKSRPR